MPLVINGLSLVPLLQRSFAYLLSSLLNPVVVIVDDVVIGGVVVVAVVVTIEGESVGGK